MRLLGVRKLAQRLLWAPILGALLLAATDLPLVTPSGSGLCWIPTGASDGSVGAPLLLWLIRVLASSRVRLRRTPPRSWPAIRRRLALLA